MNGPASMLAAQLPARSHTWPDGISTAAPLAAELLVNALE